MSETAAAAAAGGLSKTGAALAVSLVGASCLLFLLLPGPWLHDYSEWLFQATVLGLKWSEPERVAGYLLADYPVPNSLGLFALAALTLLLPPLWAGKAFVVALLAAWGWLLWRWMAAFASGTGAVARWLVFFSVFAASTFFWLGYLGYQVGLLALMIWMLRSRRPLGGPEQAAWGAILLLCHATVALVWGVLRLADLGQRWAAARHGQQRRRELAQAVAVVAPAALLAGWYLLASRSLAGAVTSVQAQMSGWVESLVYKAGFPLMLGPFRSVLLPEGQSVFEAQPLLYWAGAFCNLVVIGGLAAWGVWVCWRLRPDAPRLAAVLGRPGWLALSLLIALYLLLPYQAFGPVNPAGRLLLPMLALALVLGPKASPRFWRALAAPALAGALLSLLGYGLLAAALPAGRLGYEVAEPRLPGGPERSVFAFHSALYSTTRYPLFNYRVLTGSGRLEQLREERFVGLGFRTGPLIDYRAPPP